MAMVGCIFLLLFVLPLQSTGHEHDCPQEKTVGDTCYKRVKNGVDTSSYGCTANCSYAKIAISGPDEERFCFKPGHLLVNDNECKYPETNDTVVPEECILCLNQPGCECPHGPKCCPYDSKCCYLFGHQYCIPKDEVCMLESDIISGNNTVSGSITNEWKNVTISGGIEYGATSGISCLTIAGYGPIAPEDSVSILPGGPGCYPIGLTAFNNLDRNQNCSWREANGNPIVFSHFKVVGNLSKCEIMPGDPCSLPFGIGGPCDIVIPRWSYNQKEGKCQEFNYGCLGNANNFESFELCSDVCSGPVCPFELPESFCTNTSCPSSCSVCCPGFLGEPATCNQGPISCPSNDTLEAAISSNQLQVGPAPCYNNTGEPKLLGGFNWCYGKMDVTMCLQNCKVGGYYYAGVEIDCCYCANELNTPNYQVSPSQFYCNTTCAGNPNQICGGASPGEHFISLYWI